MDDVTLWALARAREIVECEASALVTCTEPIKIQQIKDDSVLLAVAISEALLEAFSIGVASHSQVGPSVPAAT